MGSVFRGRDICLSKCLWTKCCDWDAPWRCGSFTLVFILIVSSPQLWKQIHWEARLLHLPLWVLGLGLWPTSLNHSESKYRRSFHQLTSITSPSCSVEAQPKGFSFPRALFYLQKHRIVFGLTSGVPATLVLTLTSVRWSTLVIPTLQRWGNRIAVG